MSTPFEPIINKFLIKIEKDKSFFSYYNVPLDEAMDLAKEQAKNYLLEAVEILTDKCIPDIDFFDYDVDKNCFNFDLTAKEQGLLASLMYEVYFDRDLVLLKAFKIALTPNTLNQFSPASERKTFGVMLKDIKAENEDKISKYAAVNRITGQRKFLDYSALAEE